MTDYIQRNSKKEYFQTDNAIFDKSEELNLKAYDILVYGCLMRYADNDEKTAFPAYTTIAKKCRISARTAIRSIKHLSEIGLIRAKPRYNKGRQTSNIYFVLDVQELLNEKAQAAQAQAAQDHEVIEVLPDGVKLLKVKNTGQYLIDDSVLMENEAGVTESHTQGCQSVRGGGD